MIDREEVIGISALQMLHPILALPMDFKGEKLDLHTRHLGDLY